MTEETRTMGDQPMSYGGGMPLRGEPRIIELLEEIVTLLKLMAPPQTPPGPTGMRVYDEAGNLIRW